MKVCYAQYCIVTFTKMGRYLGSAVFSATLFFFTLGLLFAIVGYAVPWLEPRYNYNAGIESIGLRFVCFYGKYTFPSNAGNIRPELSGCVDSTKTSRVFEEAEEKYLSPGKIAPLFSAITHATHHKFIVLLFNRLVSYGSGYALGQPDFDSMRFDSCHKLSCVLLYPTISTKEEAKTFQCTVAM